MAAATMAHTKTIPQRISNRRSIMLMLSVYHAPTVTATAGSVTGVTYPYGYGYAISAPQFPNDYPHNCLQFSRGDIQFISHNSHSLDNGIVIANTRH